MPSEKTFLSQSKTIISVLAPIYLVLLGLLILVLLVSNRYEIPISTFTRDPTVTLGGHPFTGVISNIGVLFWCSTATICLFASAFYKKRPDKLSSRFLMASGLLTLMLLLDDLFQFHESIFPEYFHVPEKVVYMGYLLIAALYLLTFKGQIANSEYIILIIAGVLFSLSIACDVLLPQTNYGFLVEDGSKLLGIVTWFIFYTRTCFFRIQEAAGCQMGNTT